jgi:hypothetical protein
MGKETKAEQTETRGTRQTVQGAKSKQRVGRPPIGVDREVLYVRIRKSTMRLLKKSKPKDMALGAWLDQYLVDVLSDTNSN